MKSVGNTDIANSPALLIDLYELAMAQAYWSDNMTDTAVFSLFFRTMPEHRNVMLACGQQTLLHEIENLHFTEADLENLRSLEMFQEGFLDWLRRFRFSGRVMAMPEGTPVFPNEPILEVEAPIAEAQLLETLAMNTIHLQTVLASKAVRLVTAANGRPVVDFGMRRMHGRDAALTGTRAYTVAGLAGTSNVLAGAVHDLPVKGTMAHSFVQAHADEAEAFRTYARLYPGTTLLVDTYDTRRAVMSIIDLLRANPELRIGAIRLDSGDLRAESGLCRELLDEAGLNDVSILASSGLDEHSIAELVASQAPIDGFGVGTAIGTSVDAPNLDLAYKLTEYAGQPRLKNSPGKLTLPGPKQVYRFYDEGGQVTHDLIAGRTEPAPSEAKPLLSPVMEQGNIIESAMVSASDSARSTQAAFQQLPASVRSIKATARFQVDVSDGLSALQQQTLAQIQNRAGTDQAVRAG